MRARALLAVTSVLLVVPAVAEAHVEVKKTSPKRGAKLNSAPSRATVTFTGTIISGTLTVKGPGGSVASVGNGGRDPRDVTRLLVGLKGSLGAGRYKASWSVKAPDGHRQRGKFRFRIRS